MGNASAIEQSLIISLIYADNETLEGLYVKVEWFSTHLHKLIVKCLLWCLESHKEYNNEIVLFYITRKNTINMSEWWEIQVLNPFATDGTINTYIDILKENSQRRILNELR